MRQLVWTMALTGALLLPGISLTVPPVRPKISRPLAIAATVMPGIDVPNNPASASPRFPWKSAVRESIFCGRGINSGAHVGGLRVRRTSPRPCAPSRILPNRRSGAPHQPFTVAGHLGRLRPVILLPGRPGVAARAFTPGNCARDCARSALGLSGPGRGAARLRTTGFTHWHGGHSGS